MEQSENRFGIRDVAFYVAVALLIGFGSGAGTSSLLLRRDRAAAPERQAAAGSAVDPGGIAGADRPARGPEDAPVTIVEFTDYQCPFCARHAQQTQPALEAQYGSTIRYVVRNFPVPQLHPMAAKAAEAAECAYEQDGFWDYRRLLFERQRELDISVLKALALEADLDGAAFDECLDSGRMAPIVERDLQDGISMGIRGTPSFFVNGRPVVGAVPLSIFESAIAAVRGGNRPAN